MVSAVIIGTSLISDNTQPLVVRWKYFDERKCFHLALSGGGQVSPLPRCRAAVQVVQCAGLHSLVTPYMLSIYSVSTQVPVHLHPPGQSAVTSSQITERRHDEEVT